MPGSSKERQTERDALVLQVRRGIGFPDLEKPQNTKKPSPRKVEVRHGTTSEDVLNRHHNNISNEGNKTETKSGRVLTQRYSVASLVVSRLDSGVTEPRNLEHRVVDTSCLFLHCTI